MTERGDGRHGLPGASSAATPGAIPPPPWADVPSEGTWSAASRQATWPTASRQETTRRMTGAAGAASLAREVSAFAADMRHVAGDLNAMAGAASARQYDARSDDGAVTVTVNGRPEVTRIRVGEEAIRSGPGRLAASLTAAVNKALESARHGTTDALLRSAGPGGQAWLRGVTDAAASPDGAEARAEAGSRSVTASSADQSITATITGLGTVTGITVSYAAMRMSGDGPRRLGTSAAEAVNAALAEAGRLDRAQHNAAVSALAPGDPRSAGAAALNHLNDEMNAMLGSLDQIDRDLDGMADGTMRDLARLADWLADRGDAAAGQAGS